MSKSINLECAKEIFDLLNIRIEPFRVRDNRSIVINYFNENDTNSKDIETLYPKYGTDTVIDTMNSTLPIILEVLDDVFEQTKDILSSMKGDVGNDKDFEEYLSSVNDRLVVRCDWYDPETKSLTPVLIKAYKEKYFPDKK